MTNSNDITRLEERLNILLNKHNEFSIEIAQLRKDIYQLKNAEQPVAPEKPVAPETKIATPESVVDRKEVSKPTPLPVQPQPKPFQRPNQKSTLEKFIGENLISKIGIIITVIGVGIGAKYSIEHKLISPLARIILGYVLGLALIVIGIRLRKKYESYSAVLVSGAMAINYFLTYAAYDFYGLIPQSAAFLLMVIFTVFTVIAAINYNKQVIAHIGLVGAYAVPFLLSDGSGRVAVLFSYMTIINIGILAVAFRKYWKSLLYSSFLITWLIYASWWLLSYRVGTHFGLALTFLSIFFLIFYAIFLGYKLLRNQPFGRSDIALVLANSFIFYGLGYGILSSHDTGEHLLGLFTVINAAIHFGVAMFVYKRRDSDKNLFYLIAGLVLLFLTVAVPVQLEGKIVTIIWAFEAALLYWIGKTKNAKMYEVYAYPIMLIATLSLFDDWQSAYEMAKAPFILLLNINFLNSFLFIIAFTFIAYIQRKYERVTLKDKKNELTQIAILAVPAVLMIAVYFSIFLEINTYWNLMAAKAANLTPQDYIYHISSFKAIWLINYSLLFALLLSIINSARFKNKYLGVTAFCISVIVVICFLTQGIISLSALRAAYLSPRIDASAFYIGIRYITYILVALVMWAMYRIITADFMQEIMGGMRKAFELFVCATILIVVSSEWFNITDLGGSSESYKLGLSILWGISSILLISYGIWKKKQHVRIAAIVLFGFTLLKLFFYDITHLNTIAKTIIFVSLGILLLGISFLYNKYKHIITDDDSEN